MYQIELNKIEKNEELVLEAFYKYDYSTDCRLSRVVRACDEREEYET